MLPIQNQELAELQTNLLSSDTEQVQLALKQLQQQSVLKLEQLRPALVLVQQLHLDEHIRQQVTEILQRIASVTDFEQWERDFEVFRSVSTHLPWGGTDYTPLQLENFTRFAQVKHIYESLLARFSLYTEFYLDLGRKLYMLFHLEDAALLCFESILTHNEYNDEAHYSLARIYEKKRQYTQALAHYERCVALNNQHLYGLLQLGHLKAKVQHQYNEAIYHYNKVIELDPYMADVYVRIAEAHYALEDFDRAQQFVEIALGINEFHEQALDLLGTLTWKVKKDYDKAIEIYQKGLDHQVHGDSGLLLGSLGELYVEHLQDVAKGRLYYEKSLRVLPSQPERVRKYIALLLDTHDYGSVVDAYENYLAEEPNDADLHAEYGNFAMFYLNDRETAEKHIKRALDINPQQLIAQRTLMQMTLDLTREIKQIITDAISSKIEEPNKDTPTDELDEDDDDEDVEGDADGDHGAASDH